MRRYLTYIVVLVLASCQEEVYLDLGNVDPQPVIEAVWTDHGNYNFVKITSSRDYYVEGEHQPITHANVQIRNLRTGDVALFRYSEQAARYLALGNVRGRVGDPYQLNVRIDDHRFVSEGTILAPPILDSITYEYRESSVFRREGYYLRLFGDIPFTEDNYYRIKMIRNDTILNNRGDYLLFDDTFGTSGLSNGMELSGFSFEVDDRVRVELYRLNRDAYEYMFQLVNLLYNDGGLFSPPPQNPVSNIRAVGGNHPVLGYFMTSPVLSETVVIEAD